MSVAMVRLERFWAVAACQIISACGDRRL